MKVTVWNENQHEKKIPGFLNITPVDCTVTSQIS